MSRPRTSTDAKRTMANRRYEILRGFGVLPKDASVASTHALRFSEVLENLGKDPKDYPAEIMILRGGSPRVEHKDAEGCRRRYRKLRAMGVDPETACIACKDGLRFHTLRAELEAQAAE